jgi:hypothetical protein
MTLGHKPTVLAWSQLIAPLCTAAKTDRTPASIAASTSVNRSANCTAAAAPTLLQLSGSYIRLSQSIKGHSDSTNAAMHFALSAAATGVLLLLLLVLPGTAVPEGLIIAAAAAAAAAASGCLGGSCCASSCCDSCNMPPSASCTHAGDSAEQSMGKLRLSRRRCSSPHMCSALLFSLSSSPTAAHICCCCCCCRGSE